jgi:hypothetical protein
VSKVSSTTPHKTHATKEEEEQSSKKCPDATCHHSSKVFLLLFWSAWEFNHRPHNFSLHISDFSTEKQKNVSFPLGAFRAAPTA